jgi:hypothetical protein
MPAQWGTLHDATGTAIGDANQAQWTRSANSPERIQYDSPPPPPGLFDENGRLVYVEGGPPMSGPE